MKADILNITGQAHLARDPLEPLEAVPKRYAEAISRGGLFITDITPSASGIVGLKKYVPNTIPENALMLDGTANTANIRVHFLAEPQNTMFGIQVTVNAVAATHIEQDPTNSRLYRGYADITVSTDLADSPIEIEVLSSTGAQAKAQISVLIGGPVVRDLTIGALPGVQTEVKRGDTVPVSGAIDNSAVSVSSRNYGVADDEDGLTLGEEDSAGAGFRTVTGTLTVSNRSGQLPARIYGVNELGTEGDDFDSAAITLNQTKPTFSNAAFTYPVGQTALKGVESATMRLTVSDADSVAYTADSGIEITDANLYQQDKQVTLAGDNAIEYSYGSNNIQLVATKASNGASASTNAALNIATVAPTFRLTIGGNPSRLRSSASGESYRFTLRPDQEIDALPTIPVPGAGTFGLWSAAGKNFNIDLTVKDTDARGEHAITGIELVGPSGIQGTTITSGDTFEIGGAVLRDLIVPALSRTVDIGFAVSNINKVEAFYKGADELTLQNSDVDVAKGFTIVDGDGNYDPTGSILMISDVAFAGANTTGTLTLTIEETM